MVAHIQMVTSMSDAMNYSHTNSIPDWKLFRFTYPKSPGWDDEFKYFQEQILDSPPQPEQNTIVLIEIAPTITNYNLADIQSVLETTPGKFHLFYFRTPDVV